MSRPAGPTGRATSGRLLGLALVSPPLLVIAVFVGIPVVLAVAFSLGATGGPNEPIASIGLQTHHASHWWGTAAAYRELLADPRFRADLAVTLVVTVVSTVVTVAVSTGAALALRLHPSRLTSALAGLTVVPLFIPVVIASWAILTFYAGDGFLRTLAVQLGLDAPIWGYTTVAVVIGSVWTSLPFATLMATSGLAAVPDALIDAARDAGASTGVLVWRVLVPLAAIPLVIATTFTAIGVLGSFTVPYFTGPNAPRMLGIDISTYFTAFDRPQQSIAMAVVVFLIASVIAAFYVWANVRSAREQPRR